MQSVFFFCFFFFFFVFFSGEGVAIQVPVKKVKKVTGKYYKYVVLKRLKKTTKKTTTKNKKKKQKNEYSKSHPSNCHQNISIDILPEQAPHPPVNTRDIQVKTDCVSL